MYMCSQKLNLNIGTEVHFLFRNRDTGVYSTEVSHNPEKEHFYFLLYFTLVCLLIEQQILIEIEFFGCFGEMDSCMKTSRKDYTE